MARRVNPGHAPERRVEPGPAAIDAVRWAGGPDGCLEVLDQTRLPGECIVLRLGDLEGVRAAISRLSIRGAPAIGVAAAFGLWLGIREAPGDGAGLDRAIAGAKARLLSARPTAANLAWAVARVEEAARQGGPKERKQQAFAAAQALLEDDVRICRRLGEVGAALLESGERILTYCNTGSLAAAGPGTALSILFEAQRAGKRVSAVACETRPLLQGSRLTMWELMRAGIDATLICDNAAATVMRQKRVDRVLVGADRIARNGDTANKIGTYGLAVLAKAHGIPFHVVAPRSTFDLALASGEEIPIEERDAAEITEIGGRRIAPAGAKAYAPAFDVTPAPLITGIVTEVGIIAPVSETTVAALLGR